MPVFRRSGVLWSWKVGSGPGASGGLGGCLPKQLVSSGVLEQGVSSCVLLLLETTGASTLTE